MLIDSNEPRLNSISYPLYPDHINHTVVVYQYLPQNCLITIFFSILLQMKIVIVTERVGRVALIIESIFKLVYPYDTSSYTTVGDVRSGLSELAGAPFPVIIGCQPEIFNNIPKFELESIKSDAVVINIDSGEIIWEDKISLPKPHLEYLKSKLDELKEDIDRSKEFNPDGYLDLTNDSLK